SRDGTLHKPLVDQPLNAQLKQNTDHGKRGLYCLRRLSRGIISTSSLTLFRVTRDVTRRLASCAP
ncbi:hypothetical protein J6590_064204, partial [Homalodisca vitripennis]